MSKFYIQGKSFIIKTEEVMKRSNIVAIIIYLILLVLLFALIVPLIVFPSSWKNYKVFSEIKQVQTWIESNTENYEEAYDEYLQDIEPTSQFVESFVYNGKKYKIGAYEFNDSKDMKEYFYSRTGISIDDKTSSSLKANYFGSFFIAYNENNNSMKGIFRYEENE